MKIRYWIFHFPLSGDDRLLDQFFARAEALGCHSTRSLISHGSVALLYESVIPEPGLKLAPEIEAGNMALEALSDTLHLDMETI